MSFTLPRTERLRSMKAIRRLFGEGSGGYVYPIRYVFLAERPADKAEQATAAETTEGNGIEATVGSGTEAEGGIEVMFSVPKKFHKRANKRNLLKRRMREAYRLGRGQLCDALQTRGVRADVALIYSTKECHSYKTVEHAVQRILEQIHSRI